MQVFCVHIRRTLIPGTSLVLMVKIHGATTTGTRFYSTGKPSVAHSHCSAFSEDIAKEVVPLYNRLRNADLLARCSMMLTQNANESFLHAGVEKVPKTEFASLKTVEMAAALAALDVNAGSKGIEQVLAKLDIVCGTNIKKHVKDTTKMCVSRARLQALQSSKVTKKS